MSEKQKQNAALKAENARLRGALESVCNSAVDCIQFGHEMMVKREIIHEVEIILKGAGHD